MRHPSPHLLSKLWHHDDIAQEQTGLTNGRVPAYEQQPSLHLFDSLLDMHLATCCAAMQH